MNIDGCRVPTDEVITNHSLGAESAISKGKYGDSKAQETHQTTGQSLGRHPANLILDGSPEVIAMFPTTAAAKAGKRNAPKQGGTYGDYAGDDAPRMGHSDNGGSAARFFHQFPHTEDGGLGIDHLFYHPKAGKADRAGSKHPTVKPIALMQYLIRHITPPGGVVLDPFAGSGTTAEAARREGFDCILMEAEPEYLDFLNDRFDIEQPAPAFDFDDILGEAMPTSSTSCGADHIFGDLL